MKKQFFLAMIILGSVAFGQVNTNAFNFNSANGDFNVRRYAGGETSGADWKRVLAPLNDSGLKTLLFNVNGDFNNGVRFDGTKVHVVGKLGIGTANPDEKLTVKGKIHAEEIKVDLLVPADYVFQKYFTGSSTLKPDYEMPSLNEIESFVKENHHLPNIPSASEIQENGLQLGEMNNLLLQKVEELTLYILEQNKRIEALEIQAAKKN